MVDAGILQAPPVEKVGVGTLEKEVIEITHLRTVDSVYRGSVLLASIPILSMSSGMLGGKGYLFMWSSVYIFYF